MNTQRSSPHALTLSRQLELFPESTFTERWNAHKPSWRHPDQGGFTARLYEVAAISEAKARDFILAHHYSESCPAMVHPFGMFEAGQLVGVAVLSVPVRAEVLTKPFPDLVPYRESLELGRFVLLDSIPSNGETWLLARVFELARKEGVAGIVSFSDPVARTTLEGSVVFPGHIGHIYRTKGAIYTGRSNPRTIHLLPNGTVLSERTIQKIRKQESGHLAAEQRLHALGAPARTAWETPNQWLARAFAAIPVRRFSHAGNHRYVFPLSRRVRVHLPQLPYPQRSERT